MEEDKKLATEKDSAEIWEIEVQIAKLKAKQDKLKSQVQSRLFTEGVYSSYKDSLWEVHHSMGAVTNKFDTASFEKAEPELYKELFSKYSKTSVGKDSWSWTKQKKIVLLNE